MFEQGAYQSPGCEFAELRAWVLAQLLWNPRQNDRALIREFLAGYYGPGAAGPLEQYLELMDRAAAGYSLSCFSGLNAPHLKFPVLAEAEKLWQQAEAAAAVDPECRERVHQGHLSLRYVWLARWSELQQEATALGVAWPLPPSRHQVAEEWRSVALGIPGKPWTRVTQLNERGLTAEKWLERFASDPAGSPAALPSR